VSAMAMSCSVRSWWTVVMVVPFWLGDAKSQMRRFFRAL
jgi:hypothetical protein